MSSEYFLTQIIYKPEINNNKNVRIFGEDFVKINKNIVKILFNNKEEDLQNYYENINKDYNHKDEFQIVLKGLNEVTNMGSMFSRCIYLSSFYTLVVNLWLATLLILQMIIITLIPIFCLIIEN